MERLEAEFHIVTPCFLGGADQNTAEVRLPSLKGALRFWWRALAYASFDGCIRQLAQREEYLFGSSKQGQSRFLMHVMKATPTTNQSGAVTNNRNGIRYLYGQQSPRQCLWHDTQFTLCVMARTSADLEELVPALKLLGLLGAVGNRSRKGFGSLTLANLKRNGEIQWSQPATLEIYRDTLHCLLEGPRRWQEEPEISAFSRHARVDFLMQGNDPIDLMDKYGIAMMQYRHKANFQQDHDWFYGEDPSPTFHPRRAVFGLPHNYFKRPDINASVRPATHERRASPLFFHVHRYDRDRYGGMALLMRSRFLPHGEQIRLKRSLRPPDRSRVPACPDWSVLTDFVESSHFPAPSILWPAGHE